MQRKHMSSVATVWHALDLLQEILVEDGFSNLFTGSALNALDL